MSQTVDLRESATGPHNSLFAPIQRELSQVERVLRQELRSDAPFVDRLLRYGCLLGGKRLRPALLLLAGQASGDLVKAFSSTIGRFSTPVLLTFRTRLPRRSR